MSVSETSIRLAERYGAHNYHPLPIVIEKADGVWVADPEGRRCMDMLSAYSALNLGHRHPAVIQALIEQANKVTLTSRAFHSVEAGVFYEKLAHFTGKTKVLAMNSGAEAVETAIKAVRRFAYRRRNVPHDQAEIIVCSGNFHGRTITAVSFSSSEACRQHFGPFTPGFKLIPYGDLRALEMAISPNTAAFLVEPIQGEAGIVMPPDGFLKEAYRVCAERGVLFVADEIQTGFGRTGKRFACDWEGVVPDVYILGKALGGGVLPISAVAADEAILDVFEPGSHGSTFGGNPLACAVASAALSVFEDNSLADHAEEVGRYFRSKLHTIGGSLIREVRGKGLFIGVDLRKPARPYCEALMKQGVLCKETHESTIRFTPPLIITKEDIDWAMTRIQAVLGEG